MKTLHKGVTHAQETCTRKLRRI